MESVTSLIDLLNKPGLLYWANKIGLSGISLKAHREQVTQAGTDKHSRVELFFKEGVRFDGCEILEQNLIDFKVLCIEQPVNNGLICGRIDLVLEKNGVKYIVDFKSSDDIYLSTKLQLSAYKHLFGADKIGLISFETYELIEIKIDTVKYFEMIKRLYQLKKLIIELDERL